MNNFITEHDYTEQKINELLRKEEEKKKYLLAELKSLPKGNLLIRKKNNDYFFSHKIEGQEKGIKRDKELIRRLARKCYIKKQISQCETNSCALKAALDYIESSKNAKPKILYKSTYERMKTVFSPIVLWEHFGLMDNNDYFIKACSKIENYRKLGYVTHTNLICTYEDDMVSEDILESIIDRYLI